MFYTVYGEGGKEPDTYVIHVLVLFLGSLQWFLFTS